MVDVYLNKKIKRILDNSSILFFVTYYRNLFIF
jgi:hypothetical protein